MAPRDVGRLELANHVCAEVSLVRVLKMLLIHDIVEIDAGDTFLYDSEAVAGQAAREVIAAERIFGLLPPEQGTDLGALWEGFEQQASRDARSARARQVAAAPAQLL